MASTDRLTIHIHSTEDMLALIPFIVGFQPDASLVLVAIDPRDRGVLFTARISLPTTPESSAALPEALEVVTAHLTPLSGVSVVLVGYGPADPVQTAVDTATDTMRQAGIPIRETLRVADGRFWRLDGSGPVDGTAFDPTESPVAATAVYAGLVALPDRDALADTLAPVTGPARDAMVAATAVACEFLVQLLDAARAEVTASGESGHNSNGDSGADPDAALHTPIGVALQKAARIYLAQAQDSYRSGRPVGDDHAAALTVLLDLPSLREFTVRRTSGEAWQIEMWTDLVRRAEPEFTAWPAIMLALCALQAGQGALASVAVDRALDVDPDNRFAHLLAHAIAAGIDPATVTALVAE